VVSGKKHSDWPRCSGTTRIATEINVNLGDSVWITGVGTATPLGHTYAAFADHLLAGRSGVERVQRFDVSEHPCQIAGQLHEVPCPGGIDPSEFGRLHRLEQLMLWCCTAALRDAHWWERRREIRIGVVLGVGAEWLEFWESDALAGGHRVCQPELDKESMIARTCRVLGLSGPAVSVSAA